MTGHCAICGSTWYMDKSTAEFRLKNSKSGKLFCSYACTAKHVSQMWEARLPQQKKPKPRDEP